MILAEYEDMNKDKLELKEETENRENVAIGVYTIDAVFLLSYLLWMLMEDASIIAGIMFILSIVWIVYSRRILEKESGMKYTIGFITNYYICTIACWMIYIINIHEKLRIPLIMGLSIEGFVRIFVKEIRDLCHKI